VADPFREDGFRVLGERQPEGALVAYAAPPAGQVAIRGRLQTVASAAEDALGAPLPESARMAARTGERTVFRLGRDHWLALSESERDFGRRIAATPGLIATDLSSARARIRIEGAAAPYLIATGVQIDLRDAAFPAGAFAQTPVGPATGIVHRRAETAFDILIARSFAESWLVWLRQAGQEFGLRLAEEDAP